MIQPAAATIPIQAGNAPFVVCAEAVTEVGVGMSTVGLPLKWWWMAIRRTRVYPSLYSTKGHAPRAVSMSQTAGYQSLTSRALSKEALSALDLITRFLIGVHPNATDCTAVAHAGNGGS